MMKMRRTYNASLLSTACGWAIHRLTEQDQEMNSSLERFSVAGSKVDENWKRLKVVSAEANTFLSQF